MTHLYLFIYLDRLFALKTNCQCFFSTQYLPLQYFYAYNQKFWSSLQYRVAVFINTHYNLFLKALSATVFKEKLFDNLIMKQIS